ncbi:MAG: hypothetical protein ACOCX7_01595 [Bacteroidota bacterium]
MKDITLNLLNTKIKEIREDNESGSSEIAENAVRVFNQAATLLPRKKDIADIEKIAEKLKAAKPAMAAVRTLIDVALEELGKLDEPFDYFPVMGKILKNKREATRISIEKCRIGIFELFDNPVVMTCSYSSAVARLFGESSDKKLTVLALESKYKGHDFAEKMIQKCKESGINAEYIAEGDTDMALKRADCVVTGADRVLPDGSAVNGSPSLFLARQAYPDTPFYVIAESYKYSGLGELAEGFEEVPCGIITKIYSDDIFK